MSLSKVISGGQTGVDQGALEAAIQCGLATGGTMPKGFLTEEGPRPDMADTYGMTEGKTADYPPRTEENIRAADATLLLCWGILGYGSRGSQLARRLADKYSKPFAAVDLQRQPDATMTLEWLTKSKVRTLNVAGNRESFRPGLRLVARAFMERLFLMATGETANDAR